VCVFGEEGGEVGLGGHVVVGEGDAGGVEAVYAGEEGVEGGLEVLLYCGGGGGVVEACCF
jgi:hypothetical protein